VLFFYCGIAFVHYSTMQFDATIIFLMIFMVVDYIQVPAKEFFFSKNAGELRIIILRRRGN
jgi:hypothetical protein